MAFEALENWFIYFILYSFIGWAYETTLCSVRAKKFINRGSLNGPICPIYGTGGVLVTLLFSSFQARPVMLFFLSAIVCCAVEYLTSWGMEKLFHARWWDYSKRFLNINGRVCLLGFVAFGAMSVLAVEFVHPWLIRFVASFPPLSRHICSAVFLLSLTADLLITLPSVLKLPGHLTALRAQMKENLKNLPPIKRLNAHQWKRLSFAFPSLRFNTLSAEWESLKADLTKKKDRLKKEIEQKVHGL